MSLLQQFHILLMLGTPELQEGSFKGRLGWQNHLPQLLPTFLLNRIWLAFWAVSTHCQLTLSFSSTNTPSFSAGLLSIAFLALQVPKITHVLVAWAPIIMKKTFKTFCCNKEMPLLIMSYLHSEHSKKRRGIKNSPIIFLPSVQHPTGLKYHTWYSVQKHFPC